MFGLIEDFLCRNANVFEKQNMMHVKSIDSKQQEICDSFEFLAKCWCDFCPCGFLSVRRDREIDKGIES